MRSDVQSLTSRVHPGEHHLLRSDTCYGEMCDLMCDFC